MLSKESGMDKNTKLFGENMKNISVKKFGYPDEFVKHGSVGEKEEKYNSYEQPAHILTEQERD